MQALAQMWARGGKDFAAAQQTILDEMSRRVAEGAGQKINWAPAGWFEPQELASVNETFTILSTSALGLSQSITRIIQQGEKADPLLAEVLSKLFDPRAWFSGLGGMDETLQRMAEGPRLADLWDTERKLFNVFNAWAVLRRRSTEHNTVMLEAWVRAANSFAKTLNEKADQKETLGSWREVLSLWIETANTALLETQRSDKYLATQRELLKASTDLRLAQQEIAAFYSEVFGYPTRAELDDVHRSVTGLRRELRALERASRDASTPQKARTRRRTSVKAGNDKTGA
jgi:polyhydroxyalkanoate synthase subunit PhaE